MQPAGLKTSELLRSAASRLDVGSVADRLVAFELRVRARWIEGARRDEGVSEERRRGIAAIEDVEVAPAPARRGA